MDGGRLTYYLKPTRRPWRGYPQVHDPAIKMAMHKLLTPWIFCCLYPFLWFTQRLQLWTQYLWTASQLLNVGVSVFKPWVQLGTDKVGFRVLGEPGAGWDTWDDIHWERLSAKLKFEVNVSFLKERARSFHPLWCRPLSDYPTFPQASWSLKVQS